MPVLNPLGFNQANVTNLFASAKTQLATVSADVTTVKTDLATLEALRLQLIQNGGNAAAEWLRIQIVNLSKGFVPYVIPGGTPALTITATEPGTARDLTQTDQRPVSAFDPSLT